MISLLVNWMGCSLFEQVFDDGPLSQTLFSVSVYFLLQFLGLRISNVLPKYFELLVPFDDLILEFSDLLFQRHH